MHKCSRPAPPHCQDELKPITCKGQSRDLEHPSNYARNDVNGNYAVTHLDVLSTLPIMRGRKEFRRAIDRALKDTKFDQDVKVQVFEGSSSCFDQADDLN